MNLWGKTATAVAAAIMFSGCGIPLTSDDLPPARPTETIGAPTASSDAATTTAPEVQFKIGDCRALTDKELHQWAVVGNRAGVSGDIGYSRGQIVQVAADQWEVAAVLFVHAPTQYDTHDNGKVEYYEKKQDGDHTKRYPVNFASAAARCIGE